MKRVVLSIGIPASGKTTLLKALAERRAFVYICPDDFRKQLTGNAADHSRDREAWAAARETLAAALARGGDVIVDATFTNQNTRRDFIRFARGAGAAEIFGLVFDIPLALARERNKLRTRVVSDEQLELRQSHLAKNPPTLVDGFDRLFALRELPELETRLD